MSARVVNATAKIKQSSLIFSRLLKKTVVVYLVDLSNTTPPTSVTSAALLADGRFKRHPDRSWITFGGPTSAYPMGENMTVVLDKLGKACKRHYSHEIRLEMAKVINKHTKIPGCIIVDALDRREHSLLAVLTREGIYAEDFASITEGHFATVKGVFAGVRISPDGLTMPVIVPSGLYKFMQPTPDSFNVSRTFTVGLLTNDLKAGGTGRTRRASVSGEIDVPVDFDGDFGSEWDWDGEGLPPASWEDPVVQMRAMSAPPELTSPTMAVLPPFITPEDFCADNDADSEGSEDATHTPPNHSPTHLTYRRSALHWGTDHRGSTSSTEGVWAVAAHRAESLGKDDE